MNPLKGRGRKVRRRTLLLSALGAGGALVVGWGILPPRSRQGSPASWDAVGQGEVALNGWIKIRPDGAVVLAMPRSEMGQGVHTALPMLVAEELELPLDRVQTEQAGADSIYGNVAMVVAGFAPHPLDAHGEAAPLKVRLGEWTVKKIARELGINATGGSSTVADAWEPLRLAAATARAALLGAAALRWKLPLNELSIEKGVVTHPSGEQAHFGELAAAASAIPPGDVTLKSQAEFKLIGQATPRKDLPSKVFGAAVYGLDVRLPGMVFASLRMAPELGGAPGGLDVSAALALSGVERVVSFPPYAGAGAGFAVVGRSWWHAERGAAAVQTDWRGRLDGALDSQQIARDLDRALDEQAGHTFYERGQADQALASVATVSGLRKVEATYHAPYLAHATMEPMNCTAQMHKGQVTIWAPTQVPQLARALAARVAGVPLEAVTVHVTQLGGGFGRRLDVDFVGQAVRIAQECGGRPVQLIWPREQDFTHDFYRPMQTARCSAVLDAQGQLQALKVRSAGDAIAPRWMARTMRALPGPGDLPDKSTAEGLFDLPYDVPHQQMAHVATRSGVPVGFWRSVGHSHNAFFTEAFIDELAAMAGRDPLAFRRAMLGRAPRHLAVLNLAAEKAGWDAPVAAGHARGIALHGSFGSIVAQVVEGSLEGGHLRVHRVDCAIDCGVCVNPATVAQQMEGSVVFALTAALYGSVHIEQGRVQGDNFPSHPLLTLAQTPVVNTYIVPSTRSPAGVGEPGVPPLAAAVASAYYQLTKQRLRTLPLATKT